MSAIIPPIVIASVNTGTDEITCSAPHGLVTGDPFLVVYSPNGGTLPAPLAPVTHYWAIRQSDTVVKLAASSSDAMTGTAINLTSVGSGTLWLLKGSPYTIPAIIVPFSQLNPDHIQAALESIEALWALMTGQVQSVFPGVTLAGLLTATEGLTAAGVITLGSLLAPSGTAPLKASTAGVLSVGYDPLVFNIAHAVPASGASINGAGGIPVLALSTSTQANWLPLTLPVGFRIASWQVQLQKTSASGTITAQLWDVNGLTAVGSQVGSNQSNNANNPGNIQLGQSSLSTVVTAGHSYLLVLQGGGVTGDFALGYSATPG
jgi:hypothetical protein